jgi:serine/threonine protein kinase
MTDFGFSKKADISRAILGTEQFMSPEYFSGIEANFYGF